ncbi:uncharacterized protein LOC128235201 [Mya arenaria]|uniref:uncharacterized protein LOC128235201 n=1 Tax=Mya arenaria TaxID=6604 RepID=UPI0022E305E6|nr:uncharacterized protein LOC128235201 [Mya arenaria]
MSLVQYILYYFVLLAYFITQVIAETCSDGSVCTGGRECCMHGCCVPGDSHANDDDDERRYAYSYRLSIWNMWYFWFVILFLMMSCFGGCGYYKQRQRIIQSHGAGATRPSFISIFQTTRRRPMPMDRYPEAMIYAGYPTAEPTVPAGFAPPPYAEVINHSDLYPPTSKTTQPNTQPQYTGYPVSSNNEPTNQMPQPPPYSEVANQVATNVQAANQNVPHQNQPSNQNEAQ